MELTANNKLKKLIVVGDRVLIKLKKGVGTDQEWLDSASRSPGREDPKWICYESGAGISECQWRRMSLGRIRKKQVKDVPLQAQKRGISRYFCKRAPLKCYMKEKNILSFRRLPYYCLNGKKTCSIKSFVLNKIKPCHLFIPGDRV